MSEVFIDTFELTYKTNFDTMRDITKKFTMIDSNKDKNVYKYTELANVGFIIITKKCSDNEVHEKGKSHKIIIRADPNRIISPKTNTKHICDIGSFMKMLKWLESSVLLWCTVNKMGKDTILATLDDFELTRVDITRDIQGVPEHIIQEYILIMRRMELYSGFKLNKQLEEHTEDFRPEDSFNAINYSKGVEFVVYNKHRAAIDQKYPEQDIEHYADTIRVEARFQRRFINKHTKGLTASEALRKMFSERDKYMEEIYHSVFMQFTDVSFLQPYWQDKLISLKLKNREKKIEKMEWLTVVMSSKKRPGLGNVMDRLDVSDKAKQNLLDYFDDIGFAPVPIMNKEIPYLQSIDSILGFGVPTEMDRSYHRYLQKHTRSKEVFFHECSE